MQKVTCLRKHFSKASQCYLLTKLEPFTKQELGTTVNGSPDKQTDHQAKQHSERLGQKRGGTGHICCSPSLAILHPVLACQPPVCEGLSTEYRVQLKDLSIYHPEGTFLVFQSYHIYHSCCS